LKSFISLILLIIILSTVFSFNLWFEFESDIKSLRFEFKNLIFLPTFFLDKSIQTAFENKCDCFVINFINGMNESDFFLLTIGLAGIQIFDDPYTSFSIIESAAITTFVTYTLKVLVGRARPNYNSSPYIFKPFNFKNEFSSFPSGHSALAWATFTPIAEKYNKIFYLIPTVFSFSRVLGNYHWTSDVIFGAIIGHLIGKNFYKNKSVP